jgi:LmbE family N-acetylglucosaminyl deacetylase
MVPFRLTDRPDGLRILLLGAHCDDIEIGCGGTIMRLVKEYKVQAVKWVVFTSNPLRREEAKECADVFLDSVASKEVLVHDLRDGHLPFFGADVKKLFEDLKSFNPDVIFTHARHDRHQDHNLLAEMTWNTFRDHTIIEYEIPKYEGDLGHPNVFVTVPASLAQMKADSIVNGYRSQAGKQWFDRETFLSLMRIRGVEAASPTKYAEGFYVSKMVV